MSQHTPGPWQMTPTASHVLANNGTGHDGVICKMAHAGVLQWAAEVATYENTANARLIAKAPEMLTLLQELVDTHPCPNGRVSDDCDQCVRARALLREIEGETL